MIDATLNYGPLWKLLIVKKTNRSALQRDAVIGAPAMAKLCKGGNTTTDILVRIRVSLDCQIGDIFELTSDKV